MNNILPKENCISAVTSGELSKNIISNIKLYKKYYFAKFFYFKCISPCLLRGVVMILSI